ncbi:TetR/AcrR family transcriptional regulator [Nonomuraea sp. NN258]|uniref:TetR/AcrR family transcriptional regulator n=1 Tax=Nonomuraea antri TaxID=2730852 RepID=UPI0015688545|nr:TetR family transcriptional regulator [Nonomuraea antri]NRQ31550.1 TetR/AcrR family transcriptional regulator [Nonomuraea antri]
MTEEPPTRELILEAAIASFTATGYTGTTIRAVARAAGVDPALVMHFFGTKDGLFQAAIKGSMPVRLMTEAFAGDPAGLGERLMTRYLELWEDPLHGGRLSAVLHAATATPGTAELLKGLMAGELLRPLTTRLTGDRADVRAALVATQLIGLAMSRYVLRIEPLASMPAAQVVAAVSPNLQRYLTGTLSLAETEAAGR